MSTFLLIHGSWQDGRCWQPAVDRLEAAGHAAVAIDLPGRSGRAALDGMTTMGACRRSIVAAARDLVASRGEPVHVVGHSLGSIPTVAAVLAEPRLFSHQTILNGYILPRLLPAVFGTLVPRNGQLQTLRRLDKAHFARCRYGLKREHLVDVLYNRCNPADAVEACDRLFPEPGLPLFTCAWRLPSADVPLAWIRCSDDAMITPTQQRWMVKRVGCTVIEMDADHSPFLSAPDTLVAHLLAIDSGAADGQRDPKTQDPAKGRGLDGKAAG